MLQELNNKFKLKRGMLVSNVYAGYIQTELSKKLDVECSSDFKVFKDNLNSTGDSYDYLVIIYDKDEDSDDETLGKLDGILYDILYERLILISDKDTVKHIKLEDKGFSSRVIDYTEGFIFNDIIKELKNWYQEDINIEENKEDNISGIEVEDVDGIEINEEVYSDSLNEDVGYNTDSGVVALNDILDSEESEEEDISDLEELGSQDVQDLSNSEDLDELEEQDNLNEYDLFEDDIVMFNKDN